ncbi:MAG: DNA-directed RNA polymerase subunit D [Nanoarchaeota archaeon]|nr:DNA-directed RNA polymerase subunit D [Nanoarchaeota archaeon]
MKQIQKKENSIVFSTELSESLANAIRRYVNEIPVFAVEDVEISKNDSPLYDETVAHRIGLVPIKMKKDIDEKKTKLILDSKKEGFVYSGEIKGAEIVYDKIPLTALSKGQELSLTATGRFGKGNEHAKFSPGLMFYREVCELEMDKSLSEEIKRLCPQNEIKEKGNKIIVLDNKKVEVGDKCEEVCVKKNKDIEINKTGELIISIESFGQMNVEDILKKSTEALKKDLAELGKKLK